MATDLDDLAADAPSQGTHERQTEPDIASLLAESEALEIPDPNDDAADVEGDRDDESDAPKADGQDAAPIKDEATLEVDGRKVTVAELKDTFSTFKLKAQQLAETDQRREVEARTAIATVQENAAQQIAALANGINDLVLPGIDMQAITRLRLEDPARAGELLSSLQIVEQWKSQMLGKAGELWQQAQAQRKTAQDNAERDRMALLQAEGERLGGEKWFTEDFRTKARGFIKSMGLPAAVAEQATHYAGAVKIIRMAMQYQDAAKRLKDGKQPVQAAQVPASGRAREATPKQQATALFAQARKTGDRRVTAKAYTSLLGG